MAGAISSLGSRKTGTAHAATSEAPWVRIVLISIALTFLMHRFSGNVLPAA